MKERRKKNKLFKLRKANYFTIQYFTDDKNLAFITKSRALFLAFLIPKEWLKRVFNNQAERKLLDSSIYVYNMWRIFVAKNKIARLDKHIYHIVSWCHSQTYIYRFTTGIFVHHHRLYHYYLRCHLRAKHFFSIPFLSHNRLTINSFRREIPVG